MNFFLLSEKCKISCSLLIIIIIIVTSCAIVATITS